MARRQTLKNALIAIAVILLMAFAVAASPQMVFADDTEHTWNVKSFEFTPSSPMINMSVIMRQDNDGIYALDLAYRYKKMFGGNCFFMPGDTCVVTYDDNSSKQFSFDNTNGPTHGLFKATDGEVITLEALFTDNAKELKASAEVSVDELAAIIGKNGVTIEYGDYWEEGNEILGNKVLTHTTLDVIEDTTHDHKTALRERNKADALCDATGMSRDCQYCQVCGKYFADYEATTELNKADLIIPMLGHKQGASEKDNETAATCSSRGGYDLIYKCERCGMVLRTERQATDLDPNAHTWDDGVETTPSTYEKTGVKTYTCKGCGKTKTEPIPSLQRTVISSASVTGVENMVYNGKTLAQTPAVMLSGKKLTPGKDYKLSLSNNKNVGTAKLTITGIGAYKGTISKSFKINPKGTAISKLTRARKGFRVKWKKQAVQTSGYEIQYALNSKFTSGKKLVRVKKTRIVSKKIRKLKRKKNYYVRIRAYKIVGGKTYYSNWSKVRKIKTK